MNRGLIITFAAVVAVAAAGATVAFMPRAPHPQPAPSAAPTVEIGAPFRMTDQQGREVTDAILKTKPTVVFFGFTYCPEVCPTTLARLTGWMKELGPDADRLNILFVSVDPERDTPEQLKAYLSSFDPRIHGLTGTPQMLASMTKGYRAYYKKVELPGGGYTMDHSAMLYLFDGKGRFKQVIGYDEEGAQGLETVRRLIR